MRLTFLLSFLDVTIQQGGSWVQGSVFLRREGLWRRWDGQTLAPWGLLGESLILSWRNVGATHLAGDLTHLPCFVFLSVCFRLFVGFAAHLRTVALGRALGFATVTRQDWDAPQE